MIILVDRFLSDHRSTISEVLVDGDHVCYGLEDEYRVHKVSGETRIPAGTYNVRLRTEGTHHVKYKERYEFHKGMLHIQDVPGFEYILIHIGNSEDDTSGCLLVGESASLVYGNMRLTGSVLAYQKLYRIVSGEAGRENLTITYVDNDRKDN